MTVSPKKRIWIDTGYKLFSQMGKEALKVELIARKAGKNKSSFYHYFGDMDSYVNELLKHHIHVIESNTGRLFASKTIDPEVIDVLIDVKEDLFFHKYLRVHRDDKVFYECIKKAAIHVESGMAGAWEKTLSLDKKPMFANSFFRLISDNFFLRITPETFDRSWLLEYLKELLSMLSKMD